MPHRRCITQAMALLLELASLLLLLAGVTGCFLACGPLGSDSTSIQILLAAGGLASVALGAIAVRASRALERRAERQPLTTRGFPVKPLDRQPVPPLADDDDSELPARGSR
jgi:hypothetical protein